MALGDAKPTAPLSRDVQSPLHVRKSLEEAEPRGKEAQGLTPSSSGGGMFGAALARKMCFRSERLRDNDASDLCNYRILVLEAGPYSLPEYVQNLPTLVR